MRRERLARARVHLVDVVRAIREEERVACACAPLQHDEVARSRPTRTRRTGAPTPIKLSGQWRQGEHAARLFRRGALFSGRRVGRKATKDAGGFTGGGRKATKDARGFTGGGGGPSSVSDQPSRARNCSVKRGTVSASATRPASHAAEAPLRVRVRVRACAVTRFVAVCPTAPNVPHQRAQESWRCE